MTVEKFNQTVKESYAKYFPNSMCNIRLDKNSLYPSIWCHCYIAGTKEEMPIAQNDPFSISFRIDKGQNKDLEMYQKDTEMNEEYRLEFLSKAFKTAPDKAQEEKIGFSLYCSHKKLTFRKQTGDPEKFIKYLDKCFKQLHEEVGNCLKNGQIHKDDLELVSKKITL